MEHQLYTLTVAEMGEWLLVILVSANTTHVVSVALIVTKHISTVEHDDPCVVGVVLKRCGSPIAQDIPKGNFLPHNRTQLIVKNASIQ